MVHLHHRRQSVCGGPLLSTFYILLLTTTMTTLAEFRFCYHGPHRFHFTECPGGVLFKKPVPTDCIFFTKGSDIGDGRLQVNGDVCNSSVAEDADMSSATPKYVFSLKNIQEITYDGDLKEGTEGTDPAAHTDCFSNCLASWTEPQQIVDPSDLATASGQRSTDDNPADIEVGYRFPHKTPAIEAEQEKITEELFTRLLMDDEDPPERSSRGGLADRQKIEMRVITLLRDSFAVMTTHCPNHYIPQVFVDKVIVTMIYLTTHANTTVKEVGIREYEELLRVLAQCRVFDTHSTFRIITKDCEDPPKIYGGNVTRMTGETSVYRYQPHRYHMHLFDPFIDAAWSAVSFVHGQCFRNFKSTFNLHHVYLVAMEAMFNIRTVLERWVVAPPKLTEGDFWNNLMGVMDHVSIRHNVHACEKLAYVTDSPPSPYWKILERPFKTVNDTETDEPDTGNRDNIVPGWTRPESDYWEQYRRNGGFKKILRSMSGSCFKTDAEREAASALIQSSCSKVV